jgi:hypothetical protein
MSKLSVYLLLVLALRPQPGIVPGLQVNLAIDDRSPNFLRFYAKAIADHASERQRWDLWKKMYDFAAVPPTPEGDQMARAMLDKAWRKYAAALPRIRKGGAVFSPAPEITFTQVAKLLQADVPLHLRLIAYVGDFEVNAYTAEDEHSQPFTAVPVEVNIGMVMTHEFVHVVNAELAHLSLDWRRTVAHTIFVEGLAMRATQTLHPGQPDRSYTGEFSKNWLARCEEKRIEILIDLDPNLSSDSPDAVMRYTMGKGGAGVEREAYYAGWLVVGEMLKSGYTFRQLARMDESAIQSSVDTTIKALRARIEQQ